ncbi:MAG: pyridoxal-phosphate dependent enzyme [Bacteroidetes bacterium]|nr:MAG: pyridoxal-phosphate dependent enzyme [Bacteroidota bacterium]
MTLNSPELLQLKENIFEENNIEVFLYRLETIHENLGGNKYFKLKYNLEEAKKQQKNTILTFGGAYSNHIFATASAGNIFDFKTIGIIRGEETLPLNPTLTHAKEQGMNIVYCDRTSFKTLKLPSSSEYWQQKMGENIYFLPEGGANIWAVKGCAEIMNDCSIKPDFVCLPCGTGGTLAGVIVGNNDAKIIGFPVLKGGDFIENDCIALIKDYFSYFDIAQKKTNFELQTNYHFGGYAKTNVILKTFMTQFYEKYNIVLDEVYTAKCIFGVYDLATKKYFPPKTKILIINTQRNLLPVYQFPKK